MKKWGENFAHCKKGCVKKGKENCPQWDAVRVTLPPEKKINQTKKFLDYDTLPLSTIYNIES